jgi:hypothetical protein
MKRRGKRKLIDLEDAARLRKCHVVSFRRLVEGGKITPVDSTPPYFFDKRYILGLPPNRVGRPRSSNKNPDEGR